MKLWVFSYQSQRFGFRLTGRQAKRMTDFPSPNPLSSCSRTTLLISITQILTLYHLFFRLMSDYEVTLVNDNMQGIPDYLSMASTLRHWLAAWPSPFPLAHLLLLDLDFQKSMFDSKDLKILRLAVEFGRYMLNFPTNTHTRVRLLGSWTKYSIQILMNCTLLY